jgi:predicted nucleic acid-binding protein
LSDAYLAASARSANLEVVTFDKGFTQSPGLKYKILS